MLVAALFLHNFFFDIGPRADVRNNLRLRAAAAVRDRLGPRDLFLFDTWETVFHLRYFFGASPVFLAGLADRTPPERDELLRAIDAGLAAGHAVVTADLSESPEYPRTPEDLDAVRRTYTSRYGMERLFEERNFFGQRLSLYRLTIRNVAKD